MRNVLMTAALVALLGLFADVRQSLAQFGQGAPAAPEMIAPTRAQSGEVRNARAATHRSHKTHKHRVVHAPPNQRKIAERNGFKAVSDLVNFPKFFPGLGIIYVKPDTLPLGPFLCFDRRDRLVATVYMVPIKDIDDHKTLEAAGFTAGPVDHVSFYFNAGHPGVDMPHYHVVLWHVSRKDEARVAQ
ncbi:hypothetical protein [Bradyrhizobium sp.]|uniref:hypothetical protein n=1 Tax=Bradyrhizobium sp. TaxID=376 RepID=UPI001D7E6BBC|nr:hypothetical protein [Bradyrhizobium sp.]MBV8698461.1 hypothetical protein [Bradyrhizobium sp.]MBV8921087.1 hypothetical protein [Bradyrhizobium sp.]MBV9980301.1 hypothetical protein [Bradyrhizobium sp.]